MGLILCVLQSCSTEEILIESESNLNKGDYSYEEITFQDLKKINNNAFIESAKLKKVIATSKNKDINSASNYDIDLKSIRYIKRKNNDETFSFRIFQVPTATFQQNIVVECKKNEKPQSYLVTYYLNKQISQINTSDDFIKAIKSTSIIKIDNQFKSYRATSGDCYDIGYYDLEMKCNGDLITPESHPRCFDSNNKPIMIYVFKVITSACSGGGYGFTPLASQWDQYNTAPTDPYSGNTGSTTGGGDAESTDLNIFAPNYYDSGDLNDPAVQNMLQINQFISTIYNSSNEIKGVVDNTEWLLAYTNYWIGTNGGLTPSNQIALTYAFSNMPILFNQYNGTSYELNAINNFKFSSFQFLLFHGEFLSKLDPLTQKSILDEITSLEKIELINNVVNFMTENPSATFENTKNKLIAKAIEDQIDDSKLDPCSKGVLDKLKKLNQNDIASIFEKFGIPENGTYNIQMVTGTPNNPAAIADTKRLSKNNYVITIRESYIKGTDNNQNPPTDIAVAAILIHELIHAHFFALFDDFYNNGNNCAYDNYDCLYEKYVTKTYIGTIDEQHAQMFDNYVPKIAAILQEFKPGLSLQFYEDIAMSTMYGLQYFNDKYPKNSPDRNRIENNRNAEDSNAPRGSATPSGSPCN